MSALHLLLIAAGIALVVAVIVYNRVVEARWRRGTRGAVVHADPASDTERPAERIEPTLSFARESAAGVAGEPAVQSDRAVHGGGIAHAEQTVPVNRAPQMERAVPVERSEPPVAATATAIDTGPDGDIECIVRLEPVNTIPAGALAAGLHARVGKPLRWFGRADGQERAWERLSSDSSGRYAEVVACMLLADRNGPASTAQIEAFARLVGELAPGLPAAFVPPDAAREAQRAEALDRLCADLDVQIGLTVQKPDPETIQGTRLRGVAEASGFHLAPPGRFEYAHEDTGAVLYTLQSLKSEPFTADSLRVTAMPGAVLVLDVARVADPPHVFDQMRVAAKRLAATLGATVVDDNRRPLDDAAFAKVRAQVVAASEALDAVHIEPGSPRALALFGA